MKTWWLVLLPLFFFHISRDCGVSALPQKPAVALFNDNNNRIISVTDWRDIDLGERSIIAGRKRPAHVFALEASLNIVGTDRALTADVHRTDNLYLIPYYHLTSWTSQGESVGSCPLRHYEGYVLLRFRGGWEGDFSATLWRDSTLSMNMRGAIGHFHAAANDSRIVFPFGIKGPQAATSEGGIRRYELSGSCSDLTDECFQGRYMTYTKSFKEMPVESFTGRILFYVGFTGAWCAPWTLQLQSAMPHDSSTDVDVVVVLVDTSHWTRWFWWVTSTVPGNILVIAICILWTVFFIVALKELGVRLSETSLLTEGHVTTLYARDETEDRNCAFFHRYMLALHETFWKISSQPLAVCRRLICRFRRWLTHRRMDSHVQVSTNDGSEGVAIDDDSGYARELHVHSLISGASNSGSNTTNEADGAKNKENNDNKGEKEEKDDEDIDDADDADDDDENADFFCRICRSTKPVEELFAPCLCNGSSKYVHSSCLERWRATTSNLEHRRICAECKSPYILVLERVPVFPDEILQSPICVPAFYAFASGAAQLLLFVSQLWIGGYYLKFCMYVATGFDEGIIWSAAHLYHWVLGLYYILALCLNMCALERALSEFRESWQQLFFILLSVGALEIPLSYSGQIVLSWLLNRMWCVEVSYSLGIAVMLVLYVEVLPHLYEQLESFSTMREVVAPRAEGAQSREVV